MKIKEKIKQFLLKSKKILEHFDSSFWGDMYENDLEE